MRTKFTKFDARKPVLYHSLLELIALLLVLGLIMSLFLGVSRVSGNSMLPTCKSGEVCLYVRHVRELRRGDVVAVRMASGEQVIKRIAAVPGDELRLEGGVLFVNGENETGAPTQGETRPQVDVVHYPYTVEAGRYFLLGDNREVSIDSRTYGTVSESQILGRVIGK